MISWFVFHVIAGQRSRDSCADENVWSDFDDAGFMEDFGTARLSQQPPTNSQVMKLSMGGGGGRVQGPVFLFSTYRKMR